MGVITWFNTHNKTSWIITILIAILIFYVSSLPFEKGTIGPDITLKSVLYHFLIFFIFSFFLFISLIKGSVKKKYILLGILIAVIYCIFDEIHQIFVPNRFFDIKDILTDSAGILFSGVLYSIHCRNKNKLNT